MGHLGVEIVWRLTYLYAQPQLVLVRGVDQGSWSSMWYAVAVPDSPPAENETSRTLAAEARLLQAGVDVSGTDRAEMEAKLDELLERVRDDDAARQEFVDLLEAMGADDPRTKEYRRALTARLY